MDAGALTSAEEAELWSKGWDALCEIGRAQAGHQISEDPVERFLGLLRSALTSGVAHVADAAREESPTDPIAWGWRRDRDEWRPQGPRIGWVSESENALFLNPDAAYAAVADQARRQGLGFPLTPGVLWKRLAERGTLLEGESGRHTAKRTIGRRRVRVLVLRASILSDKIGEVGADGEIPEWAQPDRAPVTESAATGRLETGTQPA
jgi:hypothetical protein